MSERVPMTFFLCCAGWEVHRTDCFVIENSRLRAEVEDFRKAYDKKSVQLLEQDKAVRKLNAEVAALKAENESLRCERDEWRRDVHRTMETADICSREKAEALELAGKIQGQLTALRDELSQVTKERDELKDYLSAHNEGACLSRDMDNRHLRAENEKLKGWFEQEWRGVEHYKAERDQLKAEVERLRESLKLNCGFSDEVINRISALEPKAGDDTLNG